jgi:hypothetical protein
MTPTSPSAATSEPEGWLNRKRHSTVPSDHRTPVRSTGTDWLAPAVNVRLCGEEVVIGFKGRRCDVSSAGGGLAS